MPLPLLVLAECTAEPCDIPRGLPWWMGGALVVAWLAAVAGVVVLARRRLVLRAHRRNAAGAGRAGVEQASPGRDVEPW